MDFSLIHPSLFRTSKDLDEIHPLDYLNLPPIDHQFVLQPVLDKPQDPILANLLFRVSKPVLGRNTNGKAPLIQIISHEPERGEIDEPEHSGQVCALSWDQMRPDSAQRHFKREPSAFLSEQALGVHITVQGHVLQQEGTSITRISPERFHDFLRTLVNGESSHVAVWDKGQERLRTPPNSPPLVVDGIGAHTTSSLIERFLAIGTLIRRLESFVTTERSGKSSPGMHALTHCIHVIMTYLGSKMTSQVFSGHLVEDWNNYKADQEILDSLARLCLRSTEFTPLYIPLPLEPHALLSHIYNHLSFHIRSSASPRLQAIFAYILSNVALHWLEDLGRRIGLISPAGGGQLLTWQSPFAQEAEDANAPGAGAHSGRLPELPSFIPRRESTYISRGVKSLRVLREARPHHPMCRPSAPADRATTSTRGILQGWVWTEAGLERAMSGLEIHTSRMKHSITLWKQGIEPPTTSTAIAVSEPVTAMPQSAQDATSDVYHIYQPDLAGLRQFDLEPGTNSFICQRRDASTEALDQFIRHFPDALPFVAPTLEQLTQTTVSDPLVVHCRLLSSSLLELFVVDLRLLSHLDLLQRFFLFGDPGFVRRLRTALFEKVNEDDDEEVDKDQEDIALNPTLSSVKGEWPPVGYGLSFSLRSVVMEALDLDDGSAVEESDVERRIREEAEWRIGFIIKDGEQEDADTQKRWSDRSGLEALGFLTLQYRPPPTLDVLIDPDVLSKYQRVFDFLLCLLRAETAAHALYRVSARGSVSPKARQKKLLLKFCFEAHHFVKALTTYIFDSAIASHWKPFLNGIKAMHRRLTPTVAGNGKVDEKEEPNTAEVENQDGFDDVFSISTHHSDTLDKILTACFLKSRHRNAGAAVKKPLQLILDLAGVVTDTRMPDGSAEEAKEARLVELHKSWDSSMRHLTKILRALDDRGPSQSDTVTQPAENNPHIARVTSSRGSNRNLGAGDLLLRLDPSGWYGRP
ncbi:hypothetical protein FRB97_006600 [Tulasnella sp. 331]|nr:hypothetical protein FRB97_006600 [Tulasnella sp. 331]